MSRVKLAVFFWTLKLLDRLFKGTADNTTIGVKGKYRDIFIYPKDVIDMGPEDHKTSNRNLRIVKNEVADESEDLH